MTDKQSNVYLKSCQHYNTLCEICVYLCEGENFLCTLYNKVNHVQFRFYQVMDSMVTL